MAVLEGDIAVESGRHPHCAGVSQNRVNDKDGLRFNDAEYELQSDTGHRVAESERMRTTSPSDSRARH
ncbi:hypothetical protein BDZ89DRAFT_1076976 [Hymenopellis radicata]|nr:hypothetical protein BDZ89DRAFT_1076976 [Hymenopellis radicata]